MSKMDIEVKIGRNLCGFVVNNGESMDARKDGVLGGLDTNTTNANKKDLEAGQLHHGFEAKCANLATGQILQK